MTTEQIVYSENIGSPQTDIGKLVAIASGSSDSSSKSIAKRKTHFYERTEFISSIEDNFDILESMIVLPVEVAFSEDFVQRGWTKVSRKEEILDFVAKYKSAEIGEFFVRKYSDSVFSPFCNAEIRSNHVILETSSSGNSLSGFFKTSRFLDHFKLQELTFPTPETTYKYKISKDSFGSKKLIFDTIAKTDFEENGRLESMSVKSFVKFVANQKKKDREDVVTYFTGSLKQGVHISKFSENMSDFVGNPRGFAFLLGKIILKIVAKDDNIIRILEKNPQYQDDIFNFLLDLRSKSQKDSTSLDSVRFIVKFMKTIQDEPLRAVTREESNLLFKNIQKVFYLNNDGNYDYLSFFTDAYACKIPTPSKIANDFKVPVIYESDNTAEEEAETIENIYFKFSDPRIRDLGEGSFRFQCNGLEIFMEKTKGGVLIEDKKIFSSESYKNIELDIKKKTISLHGSLVNADFTEKSLAGTGVMYHKLNTTEDGRKLVSHIESEDSISIDIMSMLVAASEFHHVFASAKKTIEEGGKIKTEIELLKEQFPQIKI